MVTVKKDTIKTAKFEAEIIKTINDIKHMEKLDKNAILDSLRALHNNCLEWGEPIKDFETTWAVSK